MSSTPIPYALANGGRLDYDTLAGRLLLCVTPSRSRRHDKPPASLCTKPALPKQVYVNEQAIVDELDRWLSSIFDTEHLDQTCEQLAAASAAPTTATRYDARSRKRKVVECDHRLSCYRAALQGGADPAVVTTWIALTYRPNQRQVDVIAAPKALDVRTGRRTVPDLGYTTRAAAALVASSGPSSG